MRVRGMFAVVLLASSLAFALPTSVGAASPQISLARVKLTTVATGLTQPVAFAWRTGDLGRVYVAEQHARVVIVANGHIVSTALTLTTAGGNEQGLLGIVFSRDGTKLYVDYNGLNGDIHIDEFTMNGSVANVATRRPLLVISHHTFQNHNGGNLVLGADNMLYISVGDGGGAGDTLHNGQNLGTRLGKILRIDPNPSGSLPYTIPADNPFANQTGKRGEIWMYGLRNPWRFSFDRATHDMWIGDVGQDLYEEVDYAPAGMKGTNWEWNLREGFQPYNGGARPPGGRDPILVRPHSAGDCAIIGGYVYRGTAIANFNGAYVFGDTCTGELRAVVQEGGAVTQRRDLLLQVPQVTTFGEGPAGTIYAASRGGTLYSLTPA